ncbi:Stp1/IreP family PP2C-type Ser/Thr phosphatase [Mariniluteicoccus endophyticus]
MSDHRDTDALDEERPADVPVDETVETAANDTTSRDPDDASHDTDDAVAADEPRGPELRLAYDSHSEIGLVRKNNQDSGYASAGLLAVADGMGGAAAGDLASAVAIQMVRRADREERVHGDDMLELLAGALDQANEKIADLVADDPMLEGMGTTFTGALFDGHQLGLIHIGDSRAYLLRDGELTRLTHDHSWVQSLVDEGKITEEEAAYHPHRSLLLKVLNGHAANDPDTGLVDVRAGDRLLFCSDGLCGLVEDGLIRDIMARHDGRTEVLRDLVEEAHHEGGIDNITIVVADVVDGPGDSDVHVIGAAAEREIPQVGRRESTLRTSPASTDDAPVPGAPEPKATEASRDDEGERYAPQLAPRRTLWRRLLVFFLAMALVIGLLYAAFAWTRTQYYVGASQGQVAVYRGIDQKVLGRSLGEVVAVEQTRLEDLPPYLRESLGRTIPARDMADAQRVTRDLKDAADKCIRVRQAAQNPPTTPPNPDPSASPTPGPTPDPAEGC